MESKDNANLEQNTMSNAERLQQLKDEFQKKIQMIDVSTKADAVTTTFMQKVFKTFKFISALIIFLCVIVMACSILYGIFKGTPSFETPEFDKEMFEEAKNEKGGKEIVKGGRKERKKVQAKYEDKIENVIELLENKNDAQDQKAFDLILDYLIELPKEQRNDCINGMLDYMKDGKKYREKEGNSKKFDMNELLSHYMMEFETAGDRLDQAIAEAHAKRLFAWGVAGSAFIIILVVMMIPLLLQIEENTRKEK